MSKKLIIANFKMNPATEKECLDLFKHYQKTAKKLKNVQFVMAPPFVFLPAILKEKGMVAAQDCFYEDSGAYTGEISPLMLKNMGVKYVIVGHSERRQLGETDELISKKLQAVLRNALVPILCVGETREEKESGKKEEVIKRQISKAFSNFKFSTFPRPELGTKVNFKLVIAYEPVWAIGTGLAENPDSASETMNFISSEIKKIISKAEITIIYGGSVDAANIGAFLEKTIIQGALVGGASLKKEEFARILEIADFHPVK